MDIKIFIFGLFILSFICFIAFLIDLLLSKIFNKLFTNLENFIRKKLGYKQI